MADALVSAAAIFDLLVETDRMRRCVGGAMIRHRLASALAECDVCLQPLGDDGTYGRSRHAACKEI